MSNPALSSPPVIAVLTDSSSVVRWSARLRPSGRGMSQMQLRCRAWGFVCLSACLVFCLAGKLHAAGPATPQPRQLRLPETPFNYANAHVPSLYQDAAEQFDNTPTKNPITDAGATLGRVLFYDTSLSANGTTSCASCHQQKHAFTDPRPLSIGFDGKEVPRNSMSLVNVRYAPGGRMFWDERAATLEQQVLMPIENKVEMGHDLSRLVPQLQQDPLYPPLFEQAFDDQQVTRDRIGRALAQFVRAIVSFGSRYDIGRQQVKSPLDPFPNFTAEENYGKAQFFGRGNCATCHLEQRRSQPSSGDDVTAITQSAFFYLQQPTVNGVDSADGDDDRGVAEYTDKPSDRGRFKVPSLRNVEVTGPYMHDGRFHTIHQVIEHYNWSVRPHPNLDPRLEDFAANGMALPEVEKNALVKFLMTLTDRELLSDPRFSNPFALGDANATARRPGE